MSDVDWHVRDSTLRWAAVHAVLFGWSTDDVPPNPLAVCADTPRVEQARPVLPP